MHFTEIGGDLAAASAAFAGLLLVFLGAAVSGIEGFGKTERAPVVWRYRRRAWPAFGALVAALAACFAGLWGKGAHSDCAIWISAALLGVSAVGIVLAAVQLLVEVG